MTHTTRADSTVEFVSAHPSSTSPATQPKVASNHSKRSPIHPDDVYISRVWLALAGLGALACLGAIIRFGWPAVLAVGVLGAIAAVYTILIEPRWIKLTRLTVTLPNMPVELDGMRIGHLSDSHLGLRTTERNLRWAVKQMQREQPHLIAFTGDFLHKPQVLHTLPALLQNLRAPLGVYAVSGNHDSWESDGKLSRVLAEANVELLINEHRQLVWQGGQFYLAGTDDAWEGAPDLDCALQGVPNSAFKLLLAHTPHEAPAAAKRGIALQLSGHTHGGHMVLPLIGPFAIPRYTDAFLSGMFRVGDMALYVSRGIGGMPIRLFCRPEVALLTLRRG